ncbi:enediyne biosynthesis protein UnbU [Primorskyibacter sp. 2E107]|uniref:enediyne biosynthesis protein UnbU n=1 Tax=Primorskyibacter sp. 2E107 TaxID=3403458 RepID=UPI003AF79DCD
MSLVETSPRLFLGDRWYIDKRLKGLTRFAMAITALNILGHLFLGFEQSWITPFVAIAAAYGTEFLAETAQARADGRAPKYKGTPGTVIAFFLSAHISALAVSMLLFANEQIWVVAFAASLAVASKWLVRVPVMMGGKPVQRHVLNPSNFGITATLLLFPAVGIAPPYMFAENVTGLADWLLPMVVILTGSLLNTKLTGRMPLILAWLAAFALQAFIRSTMNGTPLLASLMPMSGFAFILFTFYMVTDPATTPGKPSHQVLFAAGVAALYAVFMQLNIVFGLFYALTLVTALRGAYLYALTTMPARDMADAGAPAVQNAR